jgi:hypothetical protein
MNLEKPQDGLEKKILSQKDYVDFLLAHPEDSQEILGYVLDEEKAKEVTVSVGDSLKIMEKMGLRPITIEELK